MLLSIEMRYLLFELYKTRKNKRFIEVSIIIYHFFNLTKNCQKAI